MITQSSLGGGYDDWVSSLTEDTMRQHLYCYLCKSHISGTYWEINEEILCDDCARMLYQRGVSELSEYEGL